MPSVSIIITSYNNRDYIRQAIETALAQGTGAFELEIIVIDDYSTDGSQELLRALAKDLSFKLVLLPKNGKLPNARNMGVAMATSEYINFLDGDDYLLPGKIKAELQYLHNNPGADIVFCDTYNEYRGVIDYEKPLSHVWVITEGNIFDRLLAGSFFAIHSALIPRDLLLQYKYDEEIVNCSEDLDLWLRISRDGKYFGYLDEPLVVYRRHSNGQSSPKVAAFADTIKALEKQANFVNIHGSDKARSNLNTYLMVNYRLLAGRQISVNDKGAVSALEKAATHGNTGRLERLVGRVLKTNYLLGKLLYLCVQRRLQW